MICSRSLFAIGLLAFLTCCKPSEPSKSEDVTKAPEPEWPTEKDIRSKLFSEIANPDLKIDQVQKGTIYLSEGRQGPKGNMVFPIRVFYQRYGYHYQKHEYTWEPSKVDAKFYKNSFSEWVVD